MLHLVERLNLLPIGISLGAHSAMAPRTSLSDKPKAKKGKFSAYLEERRKSASNQPARNRRTEYDITPGKGIRNTRVGGRVWATQEARSYGNKPALSDATIKKLLFTKGSRLKVDPGTGKVFQQSRGDAIRGIRRKR